jgi:hypothetical protein
LLTYSLEERFVELITITGHNEKLEEQEETLKGPGLFPDFNKDDEINSKRFSCERPHKFNKKVIFLSARVHPGGERRRSSGMVTISSKG